VNRHGFVGFAQDLFWQVDEHGNRWVIAVARPAYQIAASTPTAEELLEAINAEIANAKPIHR
jgi:hypothetical protein